MSHFCRVTAFSSLLRFNDLVAFTFRVAEHFLFLSAQVYKSIVKVGKLKVSSEKMDEERDVTVRNGVPKYSMTCFASRRALMRRTAILFPNKNVRKTSGTSCVCAARNNVSSPWTGNTRGT